MESNVSVKTKLVVGDDSGSANPVTIGLVESSGMSLRDYIASMSLVLAEADYNKGYVDGATNKVDEVVARAFQYADAFLAQGTRE